MRQMMSRSIKQCDRSSFGVTRTIEFSIAVYSVFLPHENRPHGSDSELASTAQAPWLCLPF
jgi:hypothetical protein